jgi:sterol desaturase/sphingolipid hydroxylase (fatty acid hydroxylase superfamily)
MTLLAAWAEWILGVFTTAQDALFEAIVQPLLYSSGLASYLTDAYDATGWFLMGIGQIVVLVLVIGPAQRWRPIEALSSDPGARRERGRAIRVDVLYTLLHRLGIFRVAMFFLIEPAWNFVFGWLAVWGVDGWHLDQAIAPWWPGVSDQAIIGFVAYWLVLDFINYWVHRAQHQFNWWWSLHALHHSQRHMSMWTDSRNHLLDSLLTDSAFVLVARAIGIPPGQFVLLVAISQLLENLSHANLRFSFGRWGERLLVGPYFHRLHHAIGVGHESHGRGTLGGCNFAVLFPVWDIIFRTANFSHEMHPTGVRDQLPEEGGRDYGQGFWAQQALGVRRLLGRSK